LIVVISTNGKYLIYVVLPVRLFDIFLEISSKKFQANGIKQIESKFLYLSRLSIPYIGIDVPGVNLFCFNGLSSTIKSKTTSEKFNVVFHFAGDPYPI